MYSPNILLILWGMVGVAVIVCLVYLTPLKWLNIVEPSINDSNPAAFQVSYTARPDAYTFIDVRPEDAYRAFHARGSISIPLPTLYEKRRSLPKSGKEIVLMGSGDRESGVGYHYLEHFGFLNLERIEGGIEKWTLAGLPVEGTQARNPR